VAVWAGVGEVKKRFRCIIDFGMIIEAESEEEALEEFAKMVKKMLENPKEMYDDAYIDIIEDD